MTTSTPEKTQKLKFLVRENENRTSLPIPRGRINIHIANDGMNWQLFLLSNCKVIFFYLVPANIILFA